MKQNRVLVWFSCGAASAVAAKLAVEKYPAAGRDVPLPDIECGVLCVVDESNREEAQEQLDMRLNRD